MSTAYLIINCMIRDFRVSVVSPVPGLLSPAKISGPDVGGGSRLNTKNVDCINDRISRCLDGRKIFDLIMKGAYIHVYSKCRFILLFIRLR